MSLMLFYEKCRLQRKVIEHQREKISMANEVDRCMARIEKVQQSYAKKEAKIDQQARLMTSHTNNMVSQMLVGQSQSMLTITPEQWMQQNNSAEYNKFVEAQKAGGSALQDYLKTDGYKSAYQLAQSGAAEYNNQISWQKQMLNQNMNTFQTSVQDQVSVWVEAQKQALADEQEMALSPLHDKQNTYEMKKEYHEKAETYNKSRLQQIEQAVSQSFQESAPKFGA